MSFLKDILTRLSSRKFLFAVAAALVLIANKQYNQAAAVVLGYLGVNYAEGRNAEPNRSDTPSEAPSGTSSDVDLP